MKEKIFWLILETIIGAGLIGVGFITQIDYYSSLIFAMGCGLRTIFFRNFNYTNTVKLIGTKEYYRKEGRVDMCKAIMDWLMILFGRRKIRNIRNGCFGKN